jgi:ComF family protein
MKQELWHIENTLSHSMLPKPIIGQGKPLLYQIFHIVRRAAQVGLDLLYPPECLSCRQAVTAHGVLCAACWGQVRFIERPFCERLGTPFVQDLGAEGLISPEAAAHPPVYGRARAVAQFEDGPVRHLIHRLKYYDRLELGPVLGGWMARAGLELLEEADVLVPVPLHRGRLHRRRYNQAALLADTISKYSGVPHDPLVLRRVRPTSPQVGLSRSQRALNLQGAFAVHDLHKLCLNNARVVLVDDVLTSGATVNAAARTLLRNGAKSVDVLVFARVVQNF